MCVSSQSLFLIRSLFSLKEIIKSTSGLKNKVTMDETIENYKIRENLHPLMYF